MASDPKPGWRRAQLSKKDRTLRSTGLHDKTLWDWMQLLVVPIVIALLAGLFTTVQILYQQAAEARLQQNQQAAEARLQQRITEQNAEIQRFIEEQRSQSASLGAYLDLMTQLLLEKNLSDSDENSVVRAIAQAQTTRVLREVDPSSEQTIFLFLYDSGIILSKAGRPPIVDVSMFDLSGANLRLTDLSSADLKGSDLNGADLSGAELVEADLSCASPVYGRGENSDQRCTDLSEANLRAASLNEANLSCAPAPEWWMEIKRTDCVDLRNANLSGADLTFADLSGANLTGAVVTQEQLRQAILLGARMPNGQQYEEWVADRKGGGEEITKRVAQVGCEEDSAVENAPTDFRQQALNDCVNSILD